MKHGSVQTSAKPASLSRLIVATAVRPRHPAGLIFGDCAADVPLLFKGGDFGHTDVKRVA